jgi:hypothetical protein
MLMRATASDSIPNLPPHATPRTPAVFLLHVKAQPRTTLALCVCVEFAGQVGTPAGTPLDTAGTSLVDIFGSNLGMEPSEVSIFYAGGSFGLSNRVYTPQAGSCVVVSAGTHIRCPTTAGVGANYSFVVTVAGGASAPSLDNLSYTPPAIRSVAGPGAALAPAAGGVTVHLIGSGFGPAGNSTALRVWAVPIANDSLSFPGRNCVVTEADVRITCLTSVSKGAVLTWRVVVEGLSNTVPQSTVAAPSLTSVTFAVPGTAHASTQGGTRLLLLGLNFGVDVEHTMVQFTVPRGVFDAQACSVVEPDIQLQCVLPEGTGVISRVAVTVLGQSTWLDVVGLAYAPPTLVSVSPATWPTDLSSVSVVVKGTGFGGPSQSGQITVVATAVSSCNMPFTLPGLGVSVLSDTELSFTIRSGTPHVTPRYMLSLRVAGQGPGVNDTLSARAAILPTMRPAAPTVTFTEAGNGTHSFLLLTGADYGPGLSNCVDDVTVTVGGVPCAELTMPKVGLCEAWGHVHRHDRVFLSSFLELMATRSTVASFFASGASFFPQAHQQLKCMTTQPRGTVSVSTAAGVATTEYDSAAAQQLPVVTRVSPPLWSTTGSTVVTLEGSRCDSVRPMNSYFCMNSFFAAHDAALRIDSTHLEYLRDIHHMRFSDQVWQCACDGE